MSEPAPLEQAPTTLGVSGWLFLLALLAGSGGLGYGLWLRWEQRAERHARANPEGSVRRGYFVRPRPAPRTLEFSLPGTVEPVASATLYARATGFVRRVQVQLGARVRSGQALAVIDAPEVAEQLASARSRLRESRESLALAQATQGRVVRLADAGTLPPQAVDDAQLRTTTAQGAVDLSHGELERLSSLANYLLVRAPFEGTVLRRYVDEGALVTAGSTRLFELATTGRLRVTVDAPQWTAALLREGVSASVAPRQGGGGATEAAITRTAGGLDPTSRTLRCELELPAGSTLLSGSYVDVRFSLQRPGGTLVVPVGTVVANGDGVQVVVLENRRARRQTVQLGRELGREVEVVQGLGTDDQLLLFPPAELTDGETVEATEQRSGGR